MELKDFTTICSSAPSEVLALIGVRRQDGGKSGRDLAAPWPKLGGLARLELLTASSISGGQACTLHAGMAWQRSQAALSVHGSPASTSSLPARRWDDILQRQLATIRANLAVLDAFFARWRHVFAWSPPHAGTVAFPRLLTGEDVGAWCEALVTEAGVLLMPASVYGDERSSAEGRFRLGFGRRDLPECLAQLEAWLQQRYPAGGQPTAGQQNQR